MTDYCTILPVANALTGSSLSGKIPVERVADCHTLKSWTPIVLVYRGGCWSLALASVSRRASLNSAGRGTAQSLTWALILDASANYKSENILPS